MSRKFAFALGLGLACGDDYELVHQGERVDIELAKGMTVCEGTGRHLDRAANQIVARLELSESETEHVLYRLVPDVSKHCTVGVACAVGSTVYASWAPFDHEVFHALSAHLSISVLEEGLATVFASTPDSNLGSGMARAAIESDELRLPGDLYRSAGHLAQAIGQDFGWRTLADFHAALELRSTPSQLADAFEQLTGEDLLLYADAVDAQPCTEDRIGLDLAGCSAPEIEPDVDGRIDWRVGGSCSSNDAVGPWRDGSFWFERSFELEIPGVRRVRYEQTSSGPVRLQLQQCGGCDVAGPRMEWGAEFDSGVAMGGGRWTVRIFAPEGTTLDGHFSVE